MEKFIITFNGDVDSELLENYGAENIETFKFIKKVAFCEMTPEQAFELKTSENKKIKDVEDNNDPDTDDNYYNQETGQYTPYSHPLMEIEKFHEMGIKGSGVKVAVMDSGTQYHEDLRIVAGFPDEFMDVSGSHGTRVAGVIGMLDNDRGGVGVAPECDLYIINRTIDGRATQIAGIDWAIRQGIDIINCSFSGSMDSTARREAFRVAAEEHDIIIVTSSGNKQNGVPLDIDTMTYPSRYPFVYAVGNIDENKNLSVTSSTGSQIEFVAPGSSGGDFGGVYTTTVDENATTSGAYDTFSGTSASAPAVAGIVALYKQMFPELGRVELMRLIQQNSERLGDRWIYGAGLPKFPKEKVNIQMNQWDDELDDFKTMNPKTTALNVEDVRGTNLQDFMDMMNFPIENNENGHFIRFPNGLQICWGAPLSQVPNDNDSESGISRSEAQRWTYPQPFKESPIFVTASVSTPWRWASPSGTPGSDGVQIRQYGSGVHSSEQKTHCFAIGYWK